MELRHFQTVYQFKEEINRFKYVALYIDKKLIFLMNRSEFYLNSRLHTKIKRNSGFDFSGKSWN